MPSIYTVGQVNTYIKQMFSQDFMLANICIKGEISNVTYHSSGHIYFTLKDKTGVISAIMFKGNRNNLKFTLEEGQKVIVLGSVNVFERDGKYQLYAKSITLEGAGLLYQRFEQLKNELSEMGLFDNMYKKPIPKYSLKIGICTAKTGAAIQDIINITKRRNPYVQLYLYSSLVQGAEAAIDIVNGIRYLDSLSLDVIIVGRGGGSIEDLWAFNDELVAHAIYESEIPVISAVGHEPDVTISDYVADLRAATPSNAAELAVPDQDALRQNLDAMSSAMASALSRQLKAARQHLNVLSQSPALRSPTGYIEQREKSLELLKNRLIAAQNQSITRKNQRYIAAVSKLDAMSPLKVLTRGYSMAQTEAGEVLRSVRQVELGERISVLLSDGKLSATVMDKKEEAR